jgi:hypothetical protein
LYGKRQENNQSRERHHMNVLDVNRNKTQLMLSLNALATYQQYPVEVARIVFPLLTEKHALQVARNPSVPVSLWRNLWGEKGKPELELATALVSRELPPPLQDFVIESETRQKVLNTFFSYQTLTSAQCARIVQKHSEKIVQRMTQYKWFDSKLRRQAAERTGNALLIESLLYEGLYSSEEKLKILLNSKLWGDSSAWKSSRLLRYVFSAEPHLALTAYNQADLKTSEEREDFLNRVIAPAVGAAWVEDGVVEKILELLRSLNAKELEKMLAEQKFLMLAMLANPSVKLSRVTEFETLFQDARTLHSMALTDSTGKRLSKGVELSETLRTESNSETLKAVLQRVKYNSRFNKPLRGPDAVELLYNSSLDESEKIQLSKELLETETPFAVYETHFEILSVYQDRTLVRNKLNTQYRKTQNTEGFLNAQEKAAVESAVDQLGTNSAAWSMLVGLCETFTGSFEELVSAVQKL